MKYTSAEANKLLKKLNDEYAALLDREKRSREFRAAMGEDIESVRPAYHYGEMQQRLAEMEQTIRSLKHAINRFNVTHQVDGFDMTIDEMLVYIPQLTKRKEKLREMRAKLPKERIEEQYGRQSNIIDYAYTNYDLAEVEADYSQLRHYQCRYFLFPERKGYERCRCSALCTHSPLWCNLGESVHAPL